MPRDPVRMPAMNFAAASRALAASDTSATFGLLAATPSTLRQPIAIVDSGGVASPALDGEHNCRARKILVSLSFIPRGQTVAPCGWRGSKDKSAKGLREVVNRMKYLVKIAAAAAVAAVASM